MYERLRKKLATELSALPAEELEVVLMALDRVMDGYEITSKETRLSIAQEEFPGLVKMYLVCKKMEGLSDCTLDNYGITLKVFFRYVWKAPGEVTTNDIRLFLYRYQEETGIKPGSLDKYREYICRFFRWCHEEGYIPTNPARNVGAIKYEEKPRVALTQVELEYLRAACIDIREKAIIEFLYSTGCRVSELSSVKLSDINWFDKSVHLFGKGKKHRTSYLNAKAQVTLQEYLKTRNDDCEYVFVTVRRPYRQITTGGIEKIVRNISHRCSNQQVRKVTPHILRHTTATTALNSGMSIVEISKLLGHEKLDTTMIYAKTSSDSVKFGHQKHVI